MNIGILGTGWIAERTAFTVNEMAKTEDVKLFAIGSRNQKTADDFAERFNIPRAFASYEELCAVPEIDLVYVATPHVFHYENMLTAINAGKNVLCEKPFTVNAKQAISIIAEADKRGVLIAEAMWTRFLPLREVFERVKDGSIGEVGEALMLEANLAYPNSHIQRMYDPELAGGALLDLGVYPINFAIMAFGDAVAEIRSSCEFFDAGVDKSNEINFIYKDGKRAKLTSSLMEKGSLSGVIRGSKGELYFENINNYEFAELRNASGEVKRFERPNQITGLEYQIRSCINAIKRGLKEPDEMKHAEIIRVMEIMDEIRAQWGMKYPFE